MSSAAVAERPRVVPVRWLILLALAALPAAGLGGVARAQDPAPAASETADPAPAEGTAQPGQLDVELSTDTALVGDRITATLTAVWMGREPRADARFPTWQETWGGAEVLDASEPEAEVDAAGRRIYRQKVALTAWEAGPVKLPPAEVVIPLDDGAVTLRGQPLEFEITSLLPEQESETDDDAGRSRTAREPGEDGAAAGTAPAAGGESGAELQPRPFVGPESLDTGRIPFFTSTAALALLLAMSLVHLQRRLAHQPAAGEGEAEPRDPLLLLPPLEELLERLARVNAADAVPAHTSLSMALRRLLARRLDFPAVESTTTEIRRHLSRQTLPAELVQSILGLLHACDLVKFAGISVETPVTAQRLEETRSVGRRIDELFRPRLPEPPASGGGGPKSAGPGGGVPDGGVPDGGGRAGTAGGHP